MNPTEWNFLSPSVSLDSKPLTSRPNSSASLWTSLSVPNIGATQYPITSLASAFPGWSSAYILNLLTNSMQKARNISAISEYVTPSFMVPSIPGSAPGCTAYVFSTVPRFCL